MFPQVLITLLLISSVNGTNATATPGVTLSPPPGYFVYNFDPTLNSSDNNPIWDPNFIPGFRMGLTNLSIHWDSGLGYGHIVYSVGPWEHLQVALPHFAVGPQCCNFIEIPRTQQYRSEDWGDYYNVKAGFSPPGVNVANFTSNFTAPAYVGLRTDWQWVASLSLHWENPRLLNPENEWAAIGVAITEYVPSAPNKLVYSVVNFWMDDNSSRVLARNPGSTQDYMIASSHVVVYHPLQLADWGNHTITVNLSPYLENTLQVLNFTATDTQPPVISYVYLNVEGYNMQWNTTLYSFLVMSNHNPSEQATGSFPSLLVYVVGVILVVAVAIIYYVRKAHGSRR